MSEEASTTGFFAAIKEYFYTMQPESPLTPIKSYTLFRRARSTSHSLNKRANSFPKGGKLKGKEASSKKKNKTNKMKKVESCSYTIDEEQKQKEHETSFSFKPDTKKFIKTKPLELDLHLDEVSEQNITSIKTPSYLKYLLSHKSVDPEFVEYNNNHNEVFSPHNFSEWNEEDELSISKYDEETQEIIRELHSE